MLKIVLEGTVDGLPVPDLKASLDSLIPVMQTSMSEPKVGSSLYSVEKLNDIFSASCCAAR